MKKFIALFIIFVMAFSMTSCKKKDVVPEDTTVTMDEAADSESAKDSKDATDTTDTTEAKPEDGTKSDSTPTADTSKKVKNKDVELINSIGKDLTSARIRPTAESDWSSNLLVDDVWKDGYALPITLKGDYPEGDNGWEVEVVYADTSAADVWKGVPINTASQITLTPTGTNY